MLRQRGRAKRSSTPDRAINGPSRFALALDRDFDPRSNRRPVTLHAHKVQVDPIVPVAGIAEETKGV